MQQKQKETWLPYTFSLTWNKFPLISYLHHKWRKMNLNLPCCEAFLNILWWRSRSFFFICFSIFLWSMFLKIFVRVCFQCFKSAPFSLLLKNESGTVSYYVHNMLRIGTVLFLDSWSNLYISYINILHESFSFLIHLLML